MTGFGRGAAEDGGRMIQVELKSVNHRFLDLSFRMPRALQSLEQDMRARIAQRLARGHVDISVSYANRAQSPRRVEIDLPLAKAYHLALQQAGQALPIRQELLFSDLAAMPDVLQVSQQEEDEEAVGQLLRTALDTALEQLIASREGEGAALLQDLQAQHAAMRALHQSMTSLAAAQPALARERLAARLAEARLQGLDDQRLAQEVALLCDRCAVDEELVRLGAHLAQLDTLLKEEGPVGRKLDFLAQELNREANTVGSKSILVDLTRAVLELKNLLEKLREQVQNIE